VGFRGAEADLAVALEVHDGFTAHLPIKARPADSCDLTPTQV